jgi:hypothetical protein
MRLDWAAKPLVASMRNEPRFRVGERRTRPFRVPQGREAARQRYAIYQQLAGIAVPPLG